MVPKMGWDFDLRHLPIYQKKNLRAILKSIIQLLFLVHNLFYLENINSLPSFLFVYILTISISINCYSSED